MKWFKHITDSGDDPDIDDAITKFGHAGYYVFFRTLEVMGREFDVDNPGVSVFTVEFLRRKYRNSWGKTLKILKFFSQKGRIILTELPDEDLPSIRLNCPKLKDLCDEYTEKCLKKNRDTVPTQVGSLSGTEVEGEEENTPSEGPPPIRNSEIMDWWNTFASELSLPIVTSFSSSRRKKFNSRKREGLWEARDELVAKIRKSPFLLGETTEQWLVTFDWLMKNDKNWVKVMEGNYFAKKPRRRDPDWTQQ